MNDDQQKEGKIQKENEIEEVVEGGNLSETTSASSNPEDPKDLKIQELTDALARSMADLQNYRRRNEGEKASFLKFATMEFLKNILPILNHLQRSVDHLPENLKENEWAKGILGIYSEMKKALEKMGVQRIEAVGKTLNPQLHEGLMSGPGEKDKIIEELEAGYTYNGDVIYPSKVKVGNGS